MWSLPLCVGPRQSRGERQMPGHVRDIVWGTCEWLGDAPSLGWMDAGGHFKPEETRKVSSKVTTCRAQEKVLRSAVHFLPATTSAHQPLISSNNPR